MPVNTPHPSYAVLIVQWKRLRDCFAGRDAVIEGGTDYLPELPGNPKSDYGTRGNFYNAVRRTVQALTGAILQKEPAFTLADAMDDLVKDLARPRQSGHAFVKRSLDEVLLMGRWGVLVDMPAQPKEGQHPYWIGYRAEDIVSWTVQEIGGVDVVTRVVLREFVMEVDPKDEFAYVRVEQYRVLSLAGGVYEQNVWRESGDKKEWGPVADKASIPNRRAKSLTFIPFIFLGPTTESAEPEAPPLVDLADINLAHWRNSADYEYAMHLVALPTPWTAGFKRAEPNTTVLQIGPAVVWEADDPSAKAGMLEFSGAGLAAIKEAMAVKEKQMATMGARLLEEQQTAPETATAVGMRHAGEHATLRTVAQSVSDGLTRALQIVVWWMGTTAEPEDEDVSVDLNLDYFQVKATPEEIKTGILAVQAGEMSSETFYALLQKGWTREGVDFEEEKATIEAESQARMDALPEPLAENAGNPLPPDGGPPQPGPVAQADGDGE